MWLPGGVFFKFETLSESVIFVRLGQGTGATSLPSPSKNSFQIGCYVLKKGVPEAKQEMVIASLDLL